MSDTYQAVYDAVRSRLSNGDIGQAVQSAMHDANLSHYAECAAHAVGFEAARVADACTTPSVLYRPALSIDGNQWCALYGVNVQDGVAGFGDSPAAAMADFNRAWTAKLEAGR